MTRKSFGISNISLDKSAGAGLWVAIILVFLQAVMAGVFYWQLPPEVPLFYSLPFGSIQLADKSMYLLLPSLAVGFLLFNIMILRVGKRIHRLVSQMVTWSTALSSFLLMIAQVYLLILVL